MQKYSVKRHQVVWNGWGLHEHFNDLVWSKWEKLKAMDVNWWQWMTKDLFISIIWHLLHLWAWIHLTMYEKTKQCHFYLLVCNLTNFYKRILGLEGKGIFTFIKVRGGDFLKECYIFYHFNWEWRACSLHHS